MTDAQTPGPDDPGRSRIRFGQPSPGAPGVSFGPAGALVGMALVVAVLGGLLWAAASGQPASAARPSLFGGSLVLEDSRPLTVINVATAQVTVRLQGVNGQVGANSYGDVQSVPVSDGTVLVNRKDGAFNFLERDDYVTDPHGTGVGLGTLTGLTGAEGLGAGSDAYILRSAPKSTVSLVGRPTVAAAAKAPGTSVTPLGFASLDGTVSLQAGGAAVSGRGLWALVATAKGCRADYLQPSATGQESLDVTTRDKPAGNCGADAVESAAGMTGIASPGSVRLFPAAAGSRPSTVAVPASRSADRILAVTGAGPDLWFLAHEKSGWSLFGVDRSGRPSGPYRLSGFSAASQPVTPVYSRGFLYTLDQTVSPQPTLWTIDPANGHMAPVRGASVYPLRSSSEKDSFQGAEVLADGPRVVFNNPQSLEAVVVFTDGSRPPAVVDKSLAVAVSTTGPADLNVTSPTTTPAGSNSKGSQKPGQPPTSQPVPVSQPVSQQVTCANTTQKPYAPQVTAITPSSGTALIAWSYELLDQTDCEPSSWSVQVTALSGSHQPANPTQVVYGQNQYLFTGLRPATRYSVVVTAYINKQSTPSTPATFTTAARGPDAPLSVSTASDGQGNWVVSWKPCTEAQNPNCVVPADQWSVIGSGCGGSYVGTPPTVQVAGGTDSVTINADNLGLLGESLSFSVQGVLASGLTGNPTGDGACTQAWRPPNAAALSLSGSGAATGSTITATLQVSVTGNPVEAFGTQPSETDFVYSIDGRTVGPTNQPKVTVSGLPAGQQFTPSVSIYPAGHPDAAVTVTGSSFSQTLPWPADLQGGTRVIPTVGSDPNTGSISVVFPPDLPAGPLKASGALLSCGSTAISETDATVSGGRIGYPMDLVNSGGDCSLSLTLRDTASPDPYGGPSPQITARFAIGTQPQYSFAVSYSQTCVVVLCQNHVVVSATGSGPMSAGGDWAVSSHSNLDHGPAQFCATNQGLSGPDFPYTFDLPSQCPPKTPVDVTVSYRYLGQDISVDAGTVSAAPPPTTTTSAPPSTTTTTTLPTVTTTPPCPTTTTAKATTTTTKATGSTTTVACAAAFSGARPGGTALAAASTPAGAARVDPVTRSVIAWLLGLAGMGWLASSARRVRRRLRSTAGRLRSRLASAVRRRRRPPIPPARAVPARADSEKGRP